MPNPFHPIRRQYFAAFLVIGAVQPYLPVWLEEAGLTKSEIGRVGALPGLAVLVAPVLMTLLADTRWSNRRTLAVLFTAGGAALGALLGVQSFWAIAMVYLLYSLTSSPVPSLQDGMYFAEEQRQRRAAESEAGGDAAAVEPPGYHSVRVWGTVGYIAATCAVTPLLFRGFSIDTAIWAGIGGCIAGVLNAFTLPRLDRAAGAEARRGAAREKLPTWQALRATMRRPLLTFMLAMFLVQAAVGAYYSFFSLYLTDLLGLDKSWVGPIVNIGVVIELAFLFGFGWMVDRFGLRNLILASVAITAVRFLLLGLFVDLWVVLALQVIHGFMVLVVHVLPPIFLNRHAEPAFRNSIQGVYAMLAMGVGRFVGSWVSGDIADSPWGLDGLFMVAAGVIAAGGGLLAWTLRHERRRPRA